MYVHLYSDIVITQHNGDDAPQDYIGLSAYKSETQRSLWFLQHLTIINRKPCFNAEYKVHCIGVLGKITTYVDKTKYKSGIVCVGR
jgi:hypothetical protein